MLTTITLYPERVTSDCTCRGLGTTMKFDVHEGPFQAPSKRGDRWLDLDDLELGIGYFHGELIVEPCEDCRRYAKRDYLRRKCGLDEEEQQIRLSQFIAEGKFSGKAEAKKAIAALAGLGRDAHGFITLHGEYGVGKSMLMKALTNELVENGQEARFISMADLLADIRSNFDKPENRTIAVESALAAWQNVPALMIDELDRANLTDWTKESIFRIVNERYESRYRLLTVMSTNTRPDYLPAEYGYIHSRMKGGIIIEVPGPDARPGLGSKAKKELEGVAV